MDANTTPQKTLEDLSSDFCLLLGLTMTSRSELRRMGIAVKGSIKEKVR
jgi:hypothetical protein